MSLSIRAGDTFGIIGKSGAGKSTLLRLINLLERPDHGAVYVAGTELTGLGKSALRAARQNIGMIFQQFNLLQNETVFENVAFRCACTAAATANRSPRGCASVWRSWGWRTSPPAIRRSCPAARGHRSRALASEPAVLLCDEPTSALDPETTRSVLGVLRDINRRLGVTIVIVTHELAVVRAVPPCGGDGERPRAGAGRDHGRAREPEFGAGARTHPRGRPSL